MSLPEPKVKPVKVSVYIDDDHRGNTLSKRSHTGIIKYVNNELINWFSKREKNVDTSSFRSELIAINITK